MTTEYLLYHEQEATKQITEKLTEKNMYDALLLLHKDIRRRAYLSYRWTAEV